MVAATKYIVVYGTTRHVDGRTAAIGSLITTAIDTVGNGAAIDINGNSTLRSTIKVVTTKYVGYLSLVGNGHRDSTFHISRNSLHGFNTRCSGSLSLFLSS